MGLSHAKFHSLKFVLALFWQTCFRLGVVKCLGLFLADINVALNLTARDNGVMFGVYSALAFCPGSINAYLYNHNRDRRALVLTGAVFISAGVILASLSMNNAFLVTSLALSGLGNSIVSTCVIIGLSEAETDHFNTFYGISKSGYAFGIIALPLIGDFLLSLYGWRGALYIIGALFGHIVPIALSLDVNKDTDKDEAVCGNENQSREKIHGDVNAKKCNINGSRCNKDENLKVPLKLAQCRKETIDDEENRKSYWSYIGALWRNSIFYRDPCQNIILMCMFFLAMVDGSWYAFVIPRAIASGISPSHAVYIAFSTAAAAFLSPALSGAATRIIDAVNIFLAATILNTISLTADLVVCSYPMMMISAFLTSSCMGSRASLAVFIGKDRASMTDFPLILAIGDLVTGLGMFWGSFLVGTIIKTFGTYHESFWLLVAMEIFVFAMMLPPRFVKSPLIAQ